MISKYLTALALILLLTLAITVPVGAFPLSYSVTVSSYGNGPLSTTLSPSKLAVLKESNLNQKSVSGPSTLYQTEIPGLLTKQVNGLSPSKGSASAFVEYSEYQKQGDNSYSLAKFSQSISLNGDITIFSFGTSYN